VKALTLWRPWGWAIVHGPKRIENRTWEPPEWLIGQRIAIHQGKHFEVDDLVHCQDLIRNIYGWDLKAPEVAQRYGIIGTAKVVGRCKVHPESGKLRCSTEEARKVLLREEFQTHWFSGPIGWVLDEVHAIAPIPCKGAQGLWDVPREIAGQIFSSMAMRGFREA
jgi:hypothetical protein